MTRKVIFRFEGANPRDKATFQGDLTGFLFICSDCMWMACGLFSVSILFWAKRVKCEEKEERENCTFFPERYMKAKKISVLDTEFGSLSLVNKGTV